MKNVPRMSNTELEIIEVLKKGATFKIDFCSQGRWLASVVNRDGRTLFGGLSKEDCFRLNMASIPSDKGIYTLCPRVEVVPLYNWRENHLSKLIKESQERLNQY